MIIVIAFLVQAHTKELTSNHDAQESVDKFVDKLLDKLFQRALNSPSLRAPHSRFLDHHSRFPTAPVGLSCESLRRIDPRRICRAESDTKEEEATETQEKKPKEMSSKGFWQLLKMGAGTFSGDLKEVNLNDPQRTLVFELEANNFEDKDGKPLDYGANKPGYVPKDGESTGSPLNVAVPAILAIVSIGIVLVSLQALNSR